MTPSTRVTADLDPDRLGHLHDALRRHWPDGALTVLRGPEGVRLTPRDYEAERECLGLVLDEMGPLLTEDDLTPTPRDLVRRSDPRLTDADLADLLGVSRQRVQQLRAGERRRPGPAAGAISYSATHCSSAARSALARVIERATEAGVGPGEWVEGATYQPSKPRRK